MAPCLNICVVAGLEATAGSPPYLSISLFNTPINTPV